MWPKVNIRHSRNNKKPGNFLQTTFRLDIDLVMRNTILAMRIDLVLPAEESRPQNTIRRQPTGARKICFQIAPLGT